MSQPPRKGSLEISKSNTKEVSGPFLFFWLLLRLFSEVNEAEEELPGEKHLNTTQSNDGGGRAAATLKNIVFTII